MGGAEHLREREKSVQACCFILLLWGLSSGRREGYSFCEVDRERARRRQLRALWERKTAAPESVLSSVEF